MGEHASVRVLVREAVRGRCEGGDELYDDFLARVVDLGRFGTDTIGAARELFGEGSAAERDAAADLLGRLVLEAPHLRDACYAALVELLGLEQGGPGDPQVVAAIGYALGHIEDDRAVPHLVGLADHASEEVRLAVARSLPIATGWQFERQYPDAIETLVRLSGDTHDDVRDWATFGLGTTNADGDEVRAALVARLDDPHEDTRAEAFMALAQLGDDRVVDPLLAELDQDSVGTLDVEAAGESADPRFFPVLTGIAEWWVDDGDLWKLQRALNRCDPSLRASALAIERQLAQVVANELAARGMPSAAVSLVGDFPRTLLTVNLEGGIAPLEWKVWEDADPTNLDPEELGEFIATQAMHDSEAE